MTELRKRMIECLQLGGLSARTQESYVRADNPDLVRNAKRRYFEELKKEFRE